MHTYTLHFMMVHDIVLLKWNEKSKYGIKPHESGSYIRDNISQAASMDRCVHVRVRSTLNRYTSIHSFRDKQQ